MSSLLNSGVIPLEKFGTTKLNVAFKVPQQFADSADYPAK